MSQIWRSRHLYSFLDRLDNLIVIGLKIKDDSASYTVYAYGTLLLRHASCYHVPRHMSQFWRRVIFVYSPCHPPTWRKYPRRRINGYVVIKYLTHCPLQGRQQRTPSKRRDASRSRDTSNRRYASIGTTATICTPAASNSSKLGAAGTPLTAATPALMVFCENSLNISLKRQQQHFRQFVKLNRMYAQDESFDKKSSAN